MALVAQTIRTVPQVHPHLLHLIMFFISREFRDTPRRILSVVSDPQPEPELEDDVFNQFALIDEGLWAWHFDLKDARGEAVASVNRAFRGLGREVSVPMN